MNPKEKFMAVFAGVVFLLIAASVVTCVLRRRSAKDEADSKRAEVIANLDARVKAWWGMAGLLGLSFLLGPNATLLVFAFSSLLALREFLTLSETVPEDHAALCVSFFLVLPFQYFLVSIQWYGLFTIMIPVYAFLVLPVFPAIRQQTTRFLERTAKTQWGLMLTVYCISHAPALMLLTIPGYNRQNALLLFYLVFVTQVSDVLQYVWGKLIGRTPIAPGVSPHKTVEGFVGGGLSAVGVGTLLWWITPFHPLQAFGFSCLIVLMGFGGGLVLSAVKRSLGAKDWGTSIAGHGGVLDRLDSLSFSAPIFFHLVRFFFAV
ncbi:MAG TPA: phosphatidate cytidylyltransferase [Chthoniobacterales bacterium]